MGCRDRFSNFKNRLPRRRHPAGDRASIQELLGIVLHHCLASSISHLPQSNEPRTSLHSSLYGERVEIRLEGGQTKKPPLLSDFMALLSQLGGYNNRANERAIGPLPVWVGLRRMMDFAIAWDAFCPEK